MIETIKSFIALLIATTVVTIGGGLLSSLVSINMNLNGYSPQIIGWVMACNYLGIVLGIFFCQGIVFHVGYIRAFAVFAAVVTAISLLHGIYISPWFWAILRIGSGLCLTGLFMVIESWLNEKVEPVFRGRLLSIYMTLVYFGIGSGQLLLNFNDVQGKSIFMLAGILFALCLIPICITRAVNPQPVRVPRYNLIKLFQLAPFSMVGSFAAGLINSSFYSLGPILGLEIGKGWRVRLKIRFHSSPCLKPHRWSGSSTLAVIRRTILMTGRPMNDETQITILVKTAIRKPRTKNPGSVLRYSLRRR